MHGIGRALVSLVTGVASCIYDSYRLGGRTLLVAPGIVAIAALPELAQHVAEICMGMFESRAAAQALANDPVRWGFGYAKIAGLTLTMLLTARFWAKDGSIRATLRIAPLVLAKIVAIAAILTLAAGRIDALGAWLWPQAQLAFTLIEIFFQAGMLVWLVGTLVDDSAISLRNAFSTRLPTAALLLLLCLVAFVPGQALHGLDHHLALGQPRVLVWALMLLDSLVVGLMAAIVGAALYVGYRSGASWRGWDRIDRRPTQNGPDAVAPGPS